MAYGQTVSGNISRGQMLVFQFPETPHEVRVDVAQTDIDIAVQTGSLSVNSSEFGVERAYISVLRAGPPVVRLMAASDGSRAGRFSLTVSPRVASTTRPPSQPPSQPPPQLPSPTPRPTEPRPSGSGPSPTDNPDFQPGAILRAQRLEAEGLAFMEPRRAETQQAAIDRLQAAADMWRAAGDSLREGNCRHWLGRALERISEHRNADKQYELAISLLHESGDVSAELNARKIWMNLGGHVGESRGKVRDLENLLASWRQVGDRRGVAMLSRSLSSAVRDTGDRTRAKALLSDSTGIWRDLGDTREEADGLLRLAGMELPEAEFEAVLQKATRALKLAREIGDEGLELSALSAFQMPLGDLGRHAEAANVAEQSRAIHWRRGDKHAWATSTAWAAHHKFQLADYTNAERLLREVHAAVEPHATPSASFVDPGTVTSGTVTTRMAANRSMQPDVSFWLFDSNRSRFHAPDGQNRIPALQKELGVDSILLAYSLNPDSRIIGDGAVWAIDNQSVSAFPLANVNETFTNALQAVDDLRQSRSPNPAALAQIATALLGPVREKTQGKRLIIVPDEGLHAFPMALLPDGPGLLGDHHEIVYALGGQAIPVLMARPKQNRSKKIAVFADPVTSAVDSRHPRKPRPPAEPEFPQLTNARDVAERIRKLAATGVRHALPSRARQQAVAAGPRLFAEFEGFDATLEAYRRESQSAEIIHLLAHAKVDLDRPGASGLALSSYTAAGARREGFLRFDEIAESKIEAELITLAACDTSTGKVIGKQGVPTLANAFLRAGARRTVSSLWKVDAAATSELMIEFYRQLFSGAKPTPAQALWNAQMHVRRVEKWKNPYYWAGFVLHGDWRRW